jgi:rRNA maturation endonuclease Nob1
MAGGIVALVIIAILYKMVDAAFSPTTACGACGHKISKRAPICPSCGDPR